LESNGDSYFPWFIPFWISNLWGEGLQIWRVAIIPSKHSRTADKGWPSSLSGRGLTTPSRKKTSCYEVLHRASYLNWFFGTIFLQGFPTKILHAFLVSTICATCFARLILHDLIILIILIPYYVSRLSSLCEEGPRLGSTFNSWPVPGMVFVLCWQSVLFTAIKLYIEVIVCHGTHIVQLVVQSAGVTDRLSVLVSAP
jgi:hypothetical protein